MLLKNRPKFDYIFYLDYLPWVDCVVIGTNAVKVNNE